jgi:hypothetical protein
MPHPPDPSHGTRFYFLDAARLRAYRGEGMPKFQELRNSDPGMLAARVVTFEEFCAGTLVTEVCTVSHRWIDRDKPDPDGTQLKKIQAHLDSHPAIKYIWYDYSCMPMGSERTVDEVEDFRRMLMDVNGLFLGTSVLLLIDLSFLSRFWTQLEAWLSMQEPGPSGLSPASAEARRRTIAPIYNASDSIQNVVVEMWSGRTPEQAFNILSSPDVSVTNQADKEVQLPKIRMLNERV